MSQQDKKKPASAKHTVLGASGAARLGGLSGPQSPPPSGELAGLDVADTFVAPRGLDAAGSPLPGPSAGSRATVLGASGAAAALEGGGRPAITAPEIGASTGSSLDAFSEALPSVDPEALVGTVVADRYRLLRVLGLGGMGVVYLAEHVVIEKRVALKVLNEELTHSRDAVSRFIYEAKAASKIGHENIVDIHDFGAMPGGGVFFVMEFLDGADLSQHLQQQGRIPWEMARRVALQVCRALASAHGKGIIHRDLKPENIFLVQQGGREDFVKILDFGIAKFTGMEGGAPRQTKTGMIFGTPDYMAPEQAEGRKADHRVDIYALGVILYQLVTGRLPFISESFMGMLHQHMTKIPTPPMEIEPALPPDFDAVIRKTLEKDPDNRYQSMQELGAALERVGSGGAVAAASQEPSVDTQAGAGPDAGLDVHPSSPSWERTAGAHSTPVQARRLRWPLVLVGLLLLGGLAAGAAWLIQRGSHGERSPGASSRDPGGSLATSAWDARAPLASKVDADAPPPQRPPVEMVTLRVTTRPSHAEVLLDGVRVGETPLLTLSIPRASSERVLELRKTGYRTEEIRFTPTESQSWERVLDRERPGVRTPPMDPVRTPPMDPVRTPPMDPVRTPPMLREAPELQDPFPMESK